MLKKPYRCWEISKLMKFAPIIAKDGTGLDLLREIRQKDLTTPFLLMSGGDDKRLEKEAKQYSGGFCCKTDYDSLSKVRELVNIET